MNIENERCDLAAEAYERVAQLASDHALVYQAAGGTILVVHPDTQRAQGIYELCQYMAGKGPHPSRRREGESSSSAQALDIGRRLARQLFRERGNHSEAHLAELDLAALCTLAAERAFAITQETSGLLPSNGNLIERLETWVRHFDVETAITDSATRERISRDLKDTLAALRTPGELQGHPIQPSGDRSKLVVDELRCDESGVAASTLKDVDCISSCPAEVPVLPAADQCNCGQRHCLICGQDPHVYGFAR